MAELGSPHGVLEMLRHLRQHGTATRAELGRSLGVGRGVVNQRLGVLKELGLVEEGDVRSPRRGRAARELRFRKDAGYVLTADLDATVFAAGVSDLAGNLVATGNAEADIADGPEPVLERVVALWRELSADAGIAPDRVWGAGIGLPGPVEFASGRPVAPPIMPGWDGFDVRGHVAGLFDVPVWVDNDVNLEALGEARIGLGRGIGDMVFVKLGVGIGAGVISASKLHRGAQGAAGDIGHVAVIDDEAEQCRCGNAGCLEVVAGAEALVRKAEKRAVSEPSTILARLVAAGRPVRITDVTAAAGHGDPLAQDLLGQAGGLVGATLASLVNFFNPALVVVGGVLVEASDLMLSTIRETIYGRSLPLATRNLVIARSGLGATGGLAGAASMAIDELLGQTRFEAWAPHRSPHGRPEIASLT